MERAGESAEEIALSWQGVCDHAEAADGEEAIVAIQLAPGDPDARLAGPELLVQLSLMEGLDEIALAELLGREQERWSASEIIAERVDSMTVKLARA